MELAMNMCRLFFMPIDIAAEETTAQIDPENSPKARAEEHEKNCGGKKK